MSSSTYVRFAAAAALVVAGCGSGAGSATQHGTASSAVTSAWRPVAPAHRWPCLSRFGVRETSTGEGVPVALIGRGPAAVVLSNESDQDACGWASSVAWLRRPDRTLALYDYASDPVANLASVIRLVRGRGARSVALLGASEGAKTSVIAAVRARPQAVVSLSAEAALAGQAVAPYAARLRAPTLFVTARQDLYGAAEATRGFFRRAPTRAKRLVTIPGDAHGTAMLRSRAVRRAVATFLAAHDA